MGFAMRLVVDIPLLRVVKDCCVAGNLMQAESSKWHVSEMAARRYLCPCRDRIDQSAPAREMRLLDTDKMWVFWLPTSSIFAGIEIDIIAWHKRISWEAVSMIFGGPAKLRSRIGFSRVSL